MLTMYFQNSAGNKRVIGTGETENDCMKIMCDFLKDHNFESYYTRVWVSSEDSHFKMYDVGSHTEFFLCYNPNGWKDI